MPEEQNGQTNTPEKDKTGMGQLIQDELASLATLQKSYKDLQTPNAEKMLEYYKKQTELLNSRPLEYFAGQLVESEHELELVRDRAHAEIVYTEEIRNANIERATGRIEQLQKTIETLKPKEEKPEKRSGPDDTLPPMSRESLPDLVKRIEDHANDPVPETLYIHEQEEEEIVLEEEVSEKIQKLPEKEKKELGKGIFTLGFQIEKKKNDWFAKNLDELSKKGDQKGTVARFIRALRNSFKQDAEMANKKIKVGPNAPVMTKLSSVAYLAKNILRPMRLVMDATGISPDGAWRLVMGGSMITARLAGAMKEARLASDEVLDQTQINDIEKAEDEAWKIYEGARKKAGTDGDVSADELKSAYLREIPKDLQKRLKNTSVADGATKGILRRHLEFDINRLNRDIENIENSEKFSLAQKEAKKEQLLRRFEKRLTDYDRVLTQTGTVDRFAMAARYAEATAKNVVRGMTVETLYLTLDKIWDGIAHIGTGHEVENIEQTEVPKASTNTEDNIPQAQVKDTTLLVDEKFDVVQKNEGIEHAFRRQIEHDPELAKALAKSSGFDGDLNDQKVLHEFSGGAAHRITLQKGYVDGRTGEEIRVRHAGEIAYKLRLTGNEADPLKVEEYRKKGDIFSVQEENDNELKLVSDQNEEYEYKYKQAPSISTLPEVEKLSEGTPPDTADALRAKIAAQIDTTDDAHASGEQKDMLTDGSAQKPPPGWNLKTNIAGNPFNLSAEILRNVDEVYTNNLQKFFSNEDAWNSIKGMRAHIVLNDSGGLTGKLGLNSVYSYLRKLEVTTELHPKDNWWWNRENVEHYIARALQKAAELGKLDELKF